MIHTESWYLQKHSGMSEEWDLALRKFRSGDDQAWEELVTLADRLGKVRELASLVKVGLNVSIQVEEFSPSRRGRLYAPVGYWIRDPATGEWRSRKPGYYEATAAQALEAASGLEDANAGTPAEGLSWLQGISDSGAVRSFLIFLGDFDLSTHNTELRADLMVDVHPGLYERGAQLHGLKRWSALLGLWKAHYGWKRRENPSA